MGAWESVFPTSTAACIDAGTGITAHYLVVFFVCRLLTPTPLISLQADETDLAVWLSAQQAYDIGHNHRP